MQGGPGGSSMLGLFTENGPFTLNDYSHDYEELKVFDNENSWHTLPANMLYVEHPAPTGFSYCSPRMCLWDDSNQAPVSYLFLKKFFEFYPEVRNNRFIMTGESYAGVLVPTLAAEIINHRDLSNKHQAPWNLDSIALGNACPGNRVFTCTPYSGWIGTKVAVDFRYRHGMISDDKYEKINAACNGQWETYEPPTSPTCVMLLEDPIRPVMSEAGDTYSMGGGYFLYDTCREADGKINKSSHMRDAVVPSLESIKRRLENGLDEIPNAGEYYCGQESSSLIYLNTPSVQKALHVKPTKFSFSTPLDYKFTAYSLLDLYRNILIPELQILQYSGDADPCVPYVGTQRWVRDMNLKTKKSWSPWIEPSRPNQPAGYLQIFDTSQGSETIFAFATVRDAGHMVPRAKPREALHLIRQFLSKFSDLK